MSSVHAGLSGSLTLAEVFFGNLAVVASFMLFCLSKRYDVRPFQALGVNHHDHFAGQQPEADLPGLAVVLSPIFTCDSEVIPNCVASCEVQAVVLDVLLALGFIPGEYCKLYLQNNRKPREI
jgi:hypothetical protein